MNGISNTLNMKGRHLKINAVFCLLSIWNILLQSDGTWVCSFSRNFAKLCGVPGFWENVLGSFCCFYIQIAYSNFTFCGAYMLIFLAFNKISAKRAHPSNIAFAFTFRAFDNEQRYYGAKLMSCKSHDSHLCTTWEQKVKFTLV